MKNILIFLAAILVVVFMVKQFFVAIEREAAFEEAKQAQICLDYPEAGCN